MDNQQHVGYEDLLKPLKDVLLKNWSMSLAHVLDGFISQIQNEGFTTNFSQAAILLQNSTTFYCKRVDVVFRIVEELTDGISQLYLAIHLTHLSILPNGEPGPSASVTPAKRRRLARTLDSDDLELLDNSCSDLNIDLNWKRYSETSPFKKIDLNKEAKALKKPGTTIPLFGANGVFFGYKDDYRLCGRTWCDGTVNDEFVDVDRQVSFGNGSDIVANGVSDDDIHFDEPMDTTEPLDGLTNGFTDPHEPDGTSHEIDASVTYDANNPPPLKELQVALRKVVDWEPVTFDFKFPLRVLKRRRLFQLPKELIAEAELEMERQKKRKIRREKREAMKANAVVDVTGNEITMDDAADDHSSALPEPDVETETAGDNEALKFKQKRMENALLATEIAKRVSEWHEAVLPKIVEAEKRRKFNVHEYGGKILEKFPDHDEQFRPFSEIVEGQPKHEVCRNFLSCLMLANTYNLEIQKTDDSPLATNCLTLKLLSKVRHHDEMDEQMEHLS